MHMAQQLHAVVYEVLKLSIDCVHVIDRVMAQRAAELKQQQSPPDVDTEH
mgnify:CR=1 FL=1